MADPSVHINVMQTLQLNQFQALKVLDAIKLVPNYSGETNAELAKEVRKDESKLNNSPTQKFQWSSRQFTNNADRQNCGQLNNFRQQNFKHPKKQLRQYQQQQNFSQQAQNADCNNQDVFRILHGRSDTQRGWGNEDNENEFHVNEEDEHEPS
jgi:hypothetical protein